MVIFPSFSLFLFLFFFPLFFLFPSFFPFFSHFLQQHRHHTTTGNDFLTKFECSLCPIPVLEDVTFIDTPGVLAGEKQTIGRTYGILFLFFLLLFLFFCFPSFSFSFSKNGCLLCCVVLCCVVLCCVVLCCVSSFFGFLNKFLR